jgi:hypothetical protein
VPNYPGWDTARLTWQASDGSSTFYRKLSYGPSRLELIKFNDPHSSETYLVDIGAIYLTAENGINGSAQTRIYPSNGHLLGLIWLPRYACSSARPAWTVDSFNQFTPCYLSQVYYNNCNTCPCQYSNTNPQHCSVNASFVVLTDFNYGGYLGALPTLIKQDTYDDNSGYEWYYYALGRGLVRFEAYKAGGQLIFQSQQTCEAPNQPIPDEACFHP